MSGSIFLAPHNDDEALFGSFLIMRYRPYVVVVFESAKQDVVGITSEMRQRETEMGLGHLLRRDFGWAQGNLPDDATLEASTKAIRSLLAGYADEFEHCFAPAWEPDGHEQHNLVAELAYQAFGSDRVTSYMTYRRGHSRSTSAWEVPFEPDWPAYKLQALGCYVSQIALPATAPWFLDYLGLREYVSAPLSFAPSVPVTVLLDPDHIGRTERL